VSVHIERKKRHRDHRGAYARLTTAAHGRPRITEDPPIRVTLDDDEQSELVDHLVAGYRTTLQDDRLALFDRFTEADVVRQVVGVGSVGMRVYLVLFEGRSGTDPLFLQFKQAGPSALEAHLGPSAAPHHGARVVQGKRLVQTATDLFVGWGSLHGHDYYVRQFRDMKIIPTIELIAPRLAEFATACGETLARAHARSGDPVAIAAYLGKGDGFLDATVAFAGHYADQNDTDNELTGIHVVTTVVDGYVPIGFIDVVLPFRSSYRPIYLGLGALGFDLLLAVLITSGLRHRIGYASWRFVHWLAYLCWPIALVHALGTGTDTQLPVILFVEVVCTAAVLGAFAWRMTTGRSLPVARRTAAAAGALVLTLIIAGFALLGPLRPGWSHRSGTSSSLLAELATKNGTAATGTTAPAAGTSPTTAPAPGSGSVPAVPFTSTVPRLGLSVARCS